MTDSATPRARSLAVFGGVATVVTIAMASEGAYFSESWGWLALALLVPTTLLVLLGLGGLPGRYRSAFALLIGGLTAWIAMSSVWSISTAGTTRELERMLVYVSVALAVTFGLRSRDAHAVFAGTVTGVTMILVYALMARLFPAILGPYDDGTDLRRLAVPFGYPNALGLLAALGIVLVIAGGVHARSTPVRSSMLSLTPPFAAVLYFTFSRGGILALLAGLTFAVLLDPLRARVLTMTFATVPGVVLAVMAAVLGTDALESEVAHRDAATVLGAVALGSVATAVLAAQVERVQPGRLRNWMRVRPRTWAAVAAVVLAGVLGVGFFRLDAVFKLPSLLRAPAASAPLNQRFLSVQGNGRYEQYRVALVAAIDAPLIGHGAGTYEYLWYERRQSQESLRDAHSLFLETLAELGLIGVAFLLAALSVPVLAAVRARASPYVAGAAAAFLAWVVGAALDWHWEMVGLTMTALLVGSVGLLAADTSSERSLIERWVWPVAGAATVLSVVAVVVLVGNQALFAGRKAVGRGAWSEARMHAERARALLPWSFEPRVLLGDAEAGLGSRERALHAYREAVEIDPRNWVAWHRLAQVASGAEQARAIARIHGLNPLEDLDVWDRK